MKNKETIKANSRPLKFRAWDRDEQKMLRPPVEFIQLLRQISQPNDNSLGGDAIRRHELEWMQYTGLKDESGVEIYESDRLLSKGESDDDDSKFTVIFAEGEWKIQYADDPTVRLGLYNFGLHRLEVIGNIYENDADLLPKL